MVARTALQLGLHRQGLRPLNPVRDLTGVADLLERVFSRELDASGRQMIREARAMGRLGPFMLLLAPLSGGLMGLSPGFVWDDHGQIIGNVTIMRSPRRLDAWQVANVAVHPDHRRRGIARALVEAAIDYTAGRGGHHLSLQVREDNPAVTLYERLGFQPLGAVTRWESAGRPRLTQILAHGRPVIPARPADWPAIWGLFSSAAPAAQGWPDRLTEEHFRPGVWRRLADLLAARSVRRWVAPSPAGQGLDGYAEYRASPGVLPQVSLRVREEAIGQVEGDLLLAALRHWSDRGQYQAIIDHPAGDVPVEGRLREAGFRPIRTLLMMQLALRPPAGERTNNEGAAGR
jgi:ribosomal protein S18 acetylase RimI-like enzyme